MPDAVIDLEKIRSNVTQIARTTGVEVWGVVKANAYGLGAETIAQAIRDQVAGYCVFSLREAVEAKLFARSGKKSITLGPPDSLNPADWLAHGVRPAVSTVKQAAALRAAAPLVCVDTGMQRFACPVQDLDAVINAGAIQEAFTHAPDLLKVQRLVEATAGKGLKLHAAASSLLSEPQAWLNAVRPGIAMYRGALRVSAPLVEVHEGHGPAGYTGFLAPRHGVIVVGYSNGLRKGPCLINGQRRRILEVGMQSAFVEITDQDRLGDEVILLGAGLTEDEVAAAWNTNPHEVIVRLSGSGARKYIG